MLRTDPAELSRYRSGRRVWQGIPSIERSAGGRLFAAWYSGGVTEQFGNYCVVVTSDDDGDTWSEPVVAADQGMQGRCYDQCLWRDPLGRLWFLWSVMPDHAVWAAICDDPDAPVLSWGEEFLVGRDVMLNRPTVLSTGAWLFPIAVWAPGVEVCVPTRNPDTGPYAFRTVDQGRTFTRLGCPAVADRSFDEHMIVERRDGSLLMLIRTRYGIARSTSSDGGQTWSDAVDSRTPGPNSRFYIARLRSGRLLMINHHDFSGRNNLTALLSDDDGETWPYRLLLDGRANVSYPDAVEDDGGRIHIIHDRERGAAYDGRRAFDTTRSDARKILYSNLTEHDIISGQLVDATSRLGVVVSRLGDFDGDPQPLYDGREQ